MSLVEKVFNNVRFRFFLLHVYIHLKAKIMKAIKKLLIPASIFLSFIYGCTVLSFYPLYTEDVLIRNDKIIGKWEQIEDQDDTLVWEIVFRSQKEKEPNAHSDNDSKEEPNEFAYSLFLYYPDKPEIKSEFQLHLVELDGISYIDFFPEQWQSADPFLDFHLIGVHTYAKVDIENDSIVVKWFDSDWFENRLKENKIRIKHEANSANILLTAKPKELQKFVSKYATDKAAFDDGIQLTLKPQR